MVPAGVIYYFEYLGKSENASIHALYPARAVYELNVSNFYAAVVLGTQSNAKTVRFGLSFSKR